MSYNDVFVKISANHHYFQVLVSVLLSFTSFLGGMELASLVIFLYVPTYHCADYQNTTNDFNASSQCNVFHTINGSSHKTQCNNWEYSEEYMTNSIVSEFNLVCNKSRYINFMFMAFFGGQVIGIGFSSLSDVIGRKTTVLAICSAEIVINIAIALVTSLNWQIVLRFCRGMCLSVYVQSLALLTELVPIKQRAFFCNAFWLLWPAGIMSASIFAYIGQDWRKTKLICLIPTSIYLLYAFVVPESPRWLLLKGKQKEAERIFKRIAWWNRSEWKSEYMHEACVTKVKTGRIKDLFRLPNTRAKQFTMCFVYWSFLTGYMGLQIDPSFFNSNPLYSIFFQGLVEIPGSLIAAFLAHKFGRKRPVLILNVCLAVAITLVPILRKFNHVTVASVLAMTVKLTFRTAFCIVDCINSEIYATSVRSMSITASRILGNMGSFIVTYINELKEIGFFIPSLLFSCQLLISSFLIYKIIPEMHNCPLAETVEESETLCAGNEAEWKKKRRHEETPI